MITNSNTQDSLFDKIWHAHVHKHEKDYPAIMKIDFTILHEVTSAQAFSELTRRNLPVRNPDRCLSVLDHSIPTTLDRSQVVDAIAELQINTHRKNSIDNKILLMDYNDTFHGISHVIAPEMGVIHPGMTVVCGDSHTPTLGAFGALAIGIGTTELAEVLATSYLLIHKPKTMNIIINGKPRQHVYVKDVIMKIIQKIGCAGALGYVIEYSGDYVSSLSMEERMTLCNMSTEAGAKSALIAPDLITYSYLQTKMNVDHAQFTAYYEQWVYYNRDENANYDKSISIDISELRPMVSWGTNPEQAIQIDDNIPSADSLEHKGALSLKESLQYNQLHENTPIYGTPIDYAFVGSCTNGRIEDLRVVAKILKDKKVHANVTFLIVPGSENVRKEAEKEGLANIFRAAGAEFRNPGCSMCVAMNGDFVPPGKRCISASNRNYIGRQGPGSYTHIASPATVAASAIVGVITSAASINDES